MAHCGLKTGQKHLFRHHKWSGENFGKSQFEPEGPHWAHFGVGWFGSAHCPALVVRVHTGTGVWASNSDWDSLTLTWCHKKRGFTVGLDALGIGFGGT